MQSHDSASRQFRLGWWFLQPHLATPGSRGSVWMVAGLGWCPHDGFARTLGQAQLACPLTQPRGLGDPQDAGLRTGWLPAPRAQLRSRPGQAQCPSHWDPTSQAVKTSPYLKRAVTLLPCWRTPVDRAEPSEGRDVNTQGHQPLCNATHRSLGRRGTWAGGMDQPPWDAAAPSGPTLPS